MSKITELINSLNDENVDEIKEQLISEANEFVYISTESFTDVDISNFLIKSRLKGIDIRILTGATSMDFSDRMQKMLRELLANDIKISTTEKYLHAKLIMTDKRVSVSSINLNKMNLGFKKVNHLWRENTESISRLKKNGKKVPVIDPSKCYGCGTCTSICPTRAIHFPEEYWERK